MIDAILFEKWKEKSKRDDAFDYFVPSDIRVMLGEIERLRAALKPFAKMYAAPGGEMDKAIQKARRALEGMK